MKSKNNLEVQVGDWLWANTNPPEPVRVTEVHHVTVWVNRNNATARMLSSGTVALMHCTPREVWPLHLGPPPLNLGPTSEEHLTAPKPGEQKTRLERVLLGWGPDPYRAHHHKLLEEGRECGCRIEVVPDLGRRNRFGHTENDHAPKPLAVDDPTGDDVAADAPGAADYFRRG